MNNVKDFILDEKITEEKEEKTAKKGTTAKPNVTYEVVLSADPDFAIRRKTAKTSNLLVILITQEQYYIKNEKSGKIKILDATSFGKFFQKLPKEGIETGVEWTSNIKSWMGHPETRELFMSVLTEDLFQGLRCLIKKKIVRINPDKTAAGYQRSFFRKNLCSVSRAFDSTEGAIVFSTLKNIVDKEHIRLCLSRYILEGPYTNATREMRCISDIIYSMTDASKDASAVSHLYDRFGPSGLRTFIEEWFNCPSNELFPSSFKIGQLMNRSDPGESFYSYARFKMKYSKTKNKREFKFDAFKNYIIYECVKQGLGYKPDHFIEIWDDTLSMQETLYGKIICKYPDNLMTYHDQLAYKVMIMMQNKEIKGFAERCAELKKFGWENDKYFIRPPKDKTDMLDEAVMQANCLSSYVERHATGKTSIFFMRDKKYPDASLVTIEVRANRLAQAKRAKNENPNSEQLDAIHKWCDEFGFVY